MLKRLPNRTLFVPPIVLLTFIATAVHGQTADSRVETLEQRIDRLEQELQATEQELKNGVSESQEQMRKTAEDVYDEKEAEGIDFGGAVRFQYNWRDYDDGNKDRGGDIDLDTFRINVDGSINDVILSAEYRWYQYMDTIHHAWVGYDFTESIQGQAGIHRVPFGVLPYNSHNFFFSGNYYVGLEDDYDAGFKMIWDQAPYNVQLAFYKNDEMGGVDGFVDQLEDRYSYDVVGFRNPGDGTFDDPRANGAQIGETNTVNARAVYNLKTGEGMNSEIGVSAQYGKLHDGSEKAGDNWAYAVHLDGDYGPWNVMLQATRYRYDLDNGAERLAVTAYSFFDTIASEANTYTAGLAYSLPVSIGPISNITFYNDYSILADKSAGLKDTWMNVSGFAVSAGGIYAYFDFINAKNQPFVGGTHDATTSGDLATRFNINVGYYF
jgi:hypothetical protein